MGAHFLGQCLLPGIGHGEDDDFARRCRIGIGQPAHIAAGLRGHFGGGIRRAARIARTDDDGKARLGPARGKTGAFVPGAA